MTGTSPRATILCQQIEVAFENTPPPGSFDEDITTTPADEGVADYFRGKTWRGHDVKKLCWHSCAFSYFTPKALRYYLPAFMLAEVRDHEAAGNIAASIVFRLKQDDAKDDLAIFSVMELMATVAFLQDCDERYSDRDFGIAIAHVKNVLRERAEVAGEYSTN